VRTGRRATGIALVFCAVGVALASSAQAAITGSQITKPTNPRYLLYNRDNPNTFAVKGKTSGGNPAHNKVDLDCFHGADHEVVATKVPLAGDGSFSVPAADLGAIEYKLCRFRAVPAGTVPSNLKPFKGPLLGVSSQNANRVSGGPNDGRLNSFYIWALQREALFDYDSVTDCGIDDGYLNDTDLEFSTVTYYCNAWLRYYEGSALDSSTRSELEIDGHDAYGPDGAKDINKDGSPGFPKLTYSLSIDPLTGQTTIHETDKFVKCPDATFPPTPTTCPGYKPTGVTDVRTIVQNHGGHLATITDQFKSTDGKAHHLDLLWQNNQHFYEYTTSPFDATTVAYRFPGENQYSTHAIGDVVNLPNTHPASILIRQAGVADGNKLSGRGAIVYDRPSDSATFNLLSTSSSNFYLHQQVNVPMNGSTTVQFAYAQAYKQADVDSLVQAAEQAIG
jgi:hypothetical protein